MFDFWVKCGHRILLLFPCSFYTPVSLCWSLSSCMLFNAFNQLPRLSLWHFSHLYFRLGHLFHSPWWNIKSWDEFRPMVTNLCHFPELKYQKSLSKALSKSIPWDSNTQCSALISNIYIWWVWDVCVMVRTLKTTGYVAKDLPNL